MQVVDKAPRPWDSGSSSSEEESSDEETENHKSGIFPAEGQISNAPQGPGNRDSVTEKHLQVARASHDGSSSEEERSEGDADEEEESPGDASKENGGQADRDPRRTGALQSQEQNFGHSSDAMDRRTAEYGWKRANVVESSPEEEEEIEIRVHDVEHADKEVQVENSQKPRQKFNDDSSEEEESSDESSVEEEDSKAQEAEGNHKEAEPARKDVENTTEQPLRKDGNEPENGLRRSARIQNQPSQATKAIAESSPEGSEESGGESASEEESKSEDDAPDSTHMDKSLNHKVTLSQLVAVFKIGGSHGFTATTCFSP